MRHRLLHPAAVMPSVLVTALIVKQLSMLTSWSTCPLFAQGFGFFAAPRTRSTCVGVGVGGPWGVTPPLFAAVADGAGGVGTPADEGEDDDGTDDDGVQWDLFLRHHARGSWRGTWTTYDYMGDMVDSTAAAVVLDGEEDGGDIAAVTQTHEIVMGSVKSDCETCFDSDNVRVLPVAKYERGNLRRQRLGSVGMVNGPTVLRSGAMSTELVLVHGDGRVRVVFQHAPAWERGVDPSSGGPPSGLKLFRTIVSREALRPLPPSRESEVADPPGDGDPKFFRPVPPFLWHKRWEGTSWTWGPTRGDQGWRIDDMEEIDAWHGRPTGDSANVWSMRLPGGILVQCPRVIGAVTGDDDDGGQAELMRLAWLPEDERLVRLEASVFAMDRPITDPSTGDLLGFYPPTLGSLRCDTLRKAGELEGVSLLEREREAAAQKGKDANEGDLDGVVKPRVDDEAQLAP